MKSAGYSGTPLLKKLGIKPGFKMMWVEAPGYYSKLLGKLPGDVQVLSRPQAPLDFIHLFTQDRKDYERRLPQLKKVLSPDGMIWVSWPKAASKVPTDVTEKVVREYALRCGLVDIKVCAVDGTWSGLKMVIPVKDRKK
ncbi:MAG TPA: DUF3052 domain-containing protein [bacterium]|nr:DUF3052 domain-containing protein [bacterium]